MSFKLHSAKNRFIDEHGEPEILVLEEDTEVLNLEGTANHKPNGDFDGSWTRYWIAFTHETDYLFCSQCGIPIWNEQDKKSVNLCKELIRTKEINKYVGEKDGGITMNDLESQGSHVRYNGKVYITPLCSEHNTNNKGKKSKFPVKAVLRHS